MTKIKSPEDVWMTDYNKCKKGLPIKILISPDVYEIVKLFQLHHKIKDFSVAIEKCLKYHINKKDEEKTTHLFEL